MERTFYSEYTTYTLENLLREYLSNPDDEIASKEVAKLINSASAFQKGIYESNDYMMPSNAYSFVRQALNMTDSDQNIDEILHRIENSSRDRESECFVNNFLKVISSDRESETEHSSQLISWR